MTETMKAAVVTEFGKPLEIREVGKPDVADGRIVVKVAARYSTDSLDNINVIFERMRQGRVDGRIVMRI